MTDTIERFSNRVENYVKYRPDYPREIVAFLAENCGLTSAAVIADIGCGPGISSRMFLENGNRVFGVEPNAAMRAAATEHLSTFPNFTAIDGTSDRTTLPDAAVDLIVSAASAGCVAATNARAVTGRAHIAAASAPLIASA